MLFILFFGLLMSIAVLTFFQYPDSPKDFFIAFFARLLSYLIIIFLVTLILIK